MSERRSTKWYRKNEERIMRMLGLKPTKNSGSGWIEKEDGQNEHVICQLKSTDARSISVRQKDIEILEYNASVASKVPMFAIQFINNDDVFIMMRPSDITAISQYIETGQCNIFNVFKSVDMSTQESMTTTTFLESKGFDTQKVIKSSESAREAYLEECKREREEKTKRWKKSQGKN